MTQSTMKYRAAATVALALIALMAASPAAAQSHCTAWVDTLLTYEAYPQIVQCVNDPSYPRASDVETFRWKGHDYMIMNLGNELEIYNVDNPANPIQRSTSEFGFDTRGDSDYDLLDFSVCDDCRYGVFSHKVQQTVVFDLGTGTVPTFPFGGYSTYTGSERDMEGHVFSKGGQQYLLVGNGPGTCTSGYDLYTLNDHDDLGFIGCIEISPGAGIRVNGMQEYDTGAALYLFAADEGGSVHVFRADGLGAGLQLTYITSPVGMKGKDYQLSIDSNNGLAASVDRFAAEIQIWDVSNPEAPMLLWTIDGEADMVSLRSPSPGAVPTLMVTRTGLTRSTRTFTVESTGPVEFEADYWADESLDHNDHPACVFPSGGGLSFDGSVLYLSRYAIHMVYDLGQCLEPTPASADLSVTPDPVFPGDSVTVRDTTSGRVDRHALWITKDGAFEYGDPPPPTADARHEISYQIPQDVFFDTVYEARIEVDSDELTPDYATCEENPGCDGRISIDRTPQASFTIEPSAVVVGDTVTLTATAEGNIGAAGFDWVITNPSGSTASRSGSVVNYVLNQSGDWDFELRVGYDHEDPASPPNLYTATDEILNYTVSSVAADFFWSPSNPVHTQAITLNASPSKPSTGLTYQWQVEEKDGGAGGYDGCPAAVQCDIPAETLQPNTWYTITLTASNGPDTSVKVDDMYVGDGAVDPSISFAPANPEIGEQVLFTIAGVPGDIDKATWTMGGSGCDGESATQTCTPSLWDQCKALAFRYSSGGNKTVTLEVEIGGNTFNADPVTLTVASTGSCGTVINPGGTCDYTLSSSSRDFGPAGGEGAFTLSTTSSCSWTAISTRSWITILSPTGNVSGSRTVRFRVDENTGMARSGIIAVGGRSFIVNQGAPWRAANFTMSKTNPEIGEVVTFTVDPVLEVVSWDFGEDDCRGTSHQYNCAWLPAGTCNTMQWTYPTAGDKSITMVLADGRTQTKGPTVKATGECCTADGRPHAGFEMSADEIYTGETVYFTDASSKSFPAKALGLSWTPPNPEIGETIAFTLDGVIGDIDKATWDFGDLGCDGGTTAVCVPSLWDECKAISFSYASGGPKSVSVTVDLQGGGAETAGPVTVDVANSGTCDDVGGNGCSYSLSPTTSSFPAEGGGGSFAVSTTSECAWNATTTSQFVTIGSGGGTGSGTVEYSVAANTGRSTRSATIRVEGQVFRIVQDGDQGNTATTAWQWTVTRIEDEEGNPVDEGVGSGNEQNFSHLFAEPGLYRVTLTASNCYGSDIELDYIAVEEAPVEDFVVGAAVSNLSGANDTNWETDLRFYNPCGENLDVRIEYQPENTNNVGEQLVFREFQLLPNETRMFGHITEAIPGLGDDPISGSVRIESASSSGCKVLSVSRTFNDTPGGSLGLFVPALPVKRVGLEFLDLAGLIHNQNYRTNLRLVNYSDVDVWVPITAYDKTGDQVGNRREVQVKGHSTKQINEIAGWLGVTDNLAPFSVRAEIDGLDVQAFATVVDNITGDSVLYLSNFFDEETIWLAGVASLSGVNDSQWRTDLWLYNPTGDWVMGEVEFVVGDSPGDVYGFEWPDLKAQRTKQYLDIVSHELGLEETRGYIVLTGDGGPAPQVAARTYNLDESGGTFGLNLRAFGSEDLLQPGETGFIAGISNSSDLSVGYRTNVGVLNTARDKWTSVRITMYDVDGAQAAEPYEIDIAPGKLRQFDIFKKLDLNQFDMTGSLKIEAVSGGAVAVYATEIDNRTQDSIFIPAQPKFIGLAN